MKGVLRFFFLVAVGSCFLTAAGSAPAKTVNVRVGAGGDFFSPSAITIGTGDKIEWNWDASFHSSTSGTPNHPSGLWSSGVLNSGSKFVREFNTVGDFAYYCSVHGVCCGMIGTVHVVQGNSTPSPTATPTATPSPTPTATPLLPLIHPGPISVELQSVASGLTAPNNLVPSGDGRLFIVEQSGRIRLVKNGTLQSTPFLDLSARLVSLNAASDERGFLGLAFHPGFNDSASPGFRKFYTYTSEPVSGPADFTVPNPASFNHQSVVAEWQASVTNPDVADPATRREVLRVDEPQANHNGGQLVFRLGEPFLYISLGDGGASNDVGDGHNSAIGNGQDLTTVLGKILRIRPLAPSLTGASGDPISANGNYRVPADNPFVNSSTAVHEIYAYGFRNPFRFSFDAATNRFIVADVGQKNVEEIDLVEAGKNYGWNRKEGSFLFHPNDGSVTVDSSPDPSLIDPVLEYSHADGQAVIGGFVERGTSVPALSGGYVFGDFLGFGSGRVFSGDFASGVIQQVNIGNEGRALGALIKGFGTDGNGDVYVLADTSAGPSGNDGTAYKLISIPTTPTLLNLSTRLNVQTGDKVLIGGFIVTGSEEEEVVLRGLGPSLTVNGTPLGGRLADPLLELHDGTGALMSSNDNWLNGPNAAELMSLHLQPNDNLESAIVAQLAPGNYTVILRDAQGGSGIGLVELYALNAAAHPANISSRGFVETGDDVLIGGFIVGGTTSRQFILRAIGPSLAGPAIPDPLLDPTLELHDGNGALLQSNNNWRDTQEAEIIASGLPPNDDREAALIATLVPGNYTAVLRGNGNTTGVALVEIYDLP